MRTIESGEAEGCFASLEVEGLIREPVPRPVVISVLYNRAAGSPFIFGNFSHQSTRTPGVPRDAVGSGTSPYSLPRLFPWPWCPSVSCPCLTAPDSEKRINT